MTSVALLRRPEPASGVRLVFLTVIIATLAILTTSCGSSGSMLTTTTPLTGNTAVTVAVTGTANDQLTEFDLAFQSITLTSQSGKTATLLSLPATGSPVGAEFLHINGTAEPLLTATIPQDIYTSASITLFSGELVCVALGQVNGQGTLSSAFYTSNIPSSAVTVNLPSPITVTGDSMALSLDLVAAKSATVGNCLSVNGFAGFSMAPVFNLAPLHVASTPTNASNGYFAGFDGEVSALNISGNSFTLSLSSGQGKRSLSINSNSRTLYQGLSDISALAVGSFVNMDGAIQSDGSLLAARIAVADPLAGDVVHGPLTEVANSTSVVIIHAREQQGKDFQGYLGGFGDFNFGSAVFQISGQLANLASLPFVPSFSGSNMVPGQEVYISAATIAYTGYPVASTLTLMPQTINAAVISSSQTGSFTDYTVSLADYDLFPMLAVQPGQTTIENNPSQVEVYVDSSTQLLNTQPLAAPSTLRFYGLVFNDNGTLRMDCAQVSDGVSLSALPSAAQGASPVSAHVDVSRAGSEIIQKTFSLPTK
jgi:Domain of unknown function (DUF5666)